MERSALRRALPGRARSAPAWLFVALTLGLVVYGLTVTISPETWFPASPGRLPL